MAKRMMHVVICAVAVMVLNFHISLDSIPAVVCSRGTLVVIIRTRDGLLVCADKRDYNNVQGPTDTGTKIFRLSDRAGFVITGARAVLERKTLQKQIDFADVVIEYFARTNGIDIANALTGLCPVLKRAGSDYLALGGNPFLESSVPLDNAFTVLHFFYVDSVRGIQATKLQFTVTTGLKPEVEIIKTDIPPQFIADGQTDVLSEILRGQDARFQDIRTDPAYKRYLSQSYSNTISVADAKSFAERIIGLTSERHSWISKSPSLVSTNTDCAHLDAKTGFQWLVH